MKQYIVVFLFVLLATSAKAQSNSFQALENNFGATSEVTSIHLRGFICRIALRMVVPEEEQFRSAFHNIRSMRLMVIPQETFTKQRLTVNGFRRFLGKDGFEELADIRDQSDHVTIYLRDGDNHQKRYFVLVEETDEVIAIELKGYIDPTVFKVGDNSLTYSKR